MQELKDTQNECDDRCLPIDRVGVKGLRFPVEVRDKGGSVLGNCFNFRSNSSFLEFLATYGTQKNVTFFSVLF